MREDERLPAGDFSSWMVEILGALSGQRGSDVPCTGCTACCTSSQFVHIGPDEIDTLSHIPADLMFAAPRHPPGHVILGYDERGHCPMLIDNECSIYEHRPRTCRTYDCRVFAAAGLEMDDEDKVMIAQRARRWQFSFPTEADRAQHDSVRAAASFLVSHPGVFPDGAVANNVTQFAVIAIEMHDSFLERDEKTNHSTVVEPDPEVVRVELRRRARVEDGT